MTARNALSTLYALDRKAVPLADSKETAIASSASTSSSTTTAAPVPAPAASASDQAALDPFAVHIEPDLIEQRMGDVEGQPRSILQSPEILAAMKQAGGRYFWRAAG